MKYGHLTKIEKLDSSIATLTILKSRLTGKFQQDVHTVIDYLKDVKEEVDFDEPIIIATPKENNDA